MASAVLSIRIPRDTYDSLNKVAVASSKDKSVIVQEALDLWFQWHALSIDEWDSRLRVWNDRLRELIRYGVNVEEATRMLALVKSDEGWMNILVTQKRKAGLDLDDFTAKELAALDRMRRPGMAG